ncbi:hypothetical protein [Limobrevibacterium gyesilva]|uniref:Flagellar basal-body protein FlbY n=1 Tax=Limobrevibacterium gyesilva TaxID=2991712 RepID=A0AA41YLX3_9PROT|nr:hypothetical protein [Limobrevibacterium gyesilva]MCW3475125.1 hypothetical protein [Limobrevibacterium gyesilva]
MTASVTQDLIDAAVALADTLAQENKALAAMDLPAAMRLLEQKQRAADAFAAARTAAAAANASPAGQQQRLAGQVAGRLRDLADENKRLLERAMAVQGRVIDVIVGAIPKAAGGVPRYTAGGGIAGPRQMPPVSLSARA